MARKKPKVLRRNKKSRKSIGRISSDDCFRSNLERTAAALLEKRNINYDYEADKVSYVLYCNYVPDFKVEINGKTVYIETKGLLDSDDRRKMIAVKEQHPDLDIRFWFSRDNTLTKKSTTKYSDWCEKNNFPYHIGDTFPKQWFL